MSVYDTVLIKRPARSRFDLSHTVRTTGNIGELHLSSRPIECVPGDTFDLKQLVTAEMQPLVAPFKGDLYLESWAFFCSNEILYDERYDEGKFSDILLTVDDPSEAIPIPNILELMDDVDDGTNKGTYWNQMGLPHIISYIENKTSICAYPFRGINKIYNDWFRDENLQDEIDLNNTQMLYVNYRKDRFTSAFTSTQKGNLPMLPLTGSAQVVYSHSEDRYPNLIQGHIAYDGNIAGTDFVDAFFENSSTKKWISNTSGTAQENPYIGIGGLPAEGSWHIDRARVVTDIDDLFDVLNSDLIYSTVDLSNIGTFTINDLRLLNSLQKWAERLQICGSRYKSYLLGNYGVAPNDETLDRPVLIGHTSTPVFVQSVLNTSSELGSKAGNGGTVQQTNFGKWTCKEFGWIYILSALRPKASYTNQAHRSLFKTSVYDFFNPIFQHLGQEEIYKGEIYFTGDSDEDMQPFGYTDRYNYMRHIEDLTTGELTDELETWAVFRKFDQAPTLSEEFIQVLPQEYDYLFSVYTENAPQCVFTFKNVISAIRPLSKYPVPAL